MIAQLRQLDYLSLNPISSKHFHACYYLSVIFVRLLCFETFQINVNYVSQFQHGLNR